MTKVFPPGTRVVIGMHGYGVAALGANVRDKFVHQCRVWRAAMWTADRSADSWQLEQATRGTFSEFGVQSGGIRRIRIEVCNSFLEPGHDFIDGRHGPLRQIAIHLISDTYIDSAVPEPTDLNVYLGVVNLLEFFGEVHKSYFGARTASPP